MKIALICSGSELLNGKLNTNAAYIGSRIFDIGLHLTSVINVGDRKEDLERIFNSAFKNCDIVISTGGLGPTFDDITVETAAQCLALEIYKNENVLNSIKNYFEKRKLLTFTKNNEKQANIIKGAKVLVNNYGTAPGQMLHFEFKDVQKQVRKTLFLLPGPPKEMKPMFEENVVSFLKCYSSKITKSMGIKVFGLAESEVEQMIMPVIKDSSFGDNNSIEFGIIASNSVIEVKFSVSGDDELLTDKKLLELKFSFENILKENIFGYGNETLASVVGKLLTTAKKTISFAESCTGGLISSALTDVPGSSLYFKNSIISYSNFAKIKILGVKEGTILNTGAVSEETAKEMAVGVLKLSESDYALSATGIAGPSGGTKEKPIGLVCIAFADKKKCEAFKFNFTGTRDNIRERTVVTALDIIRRRILFSRLKNTDK
ncbi:MAG: competence/damage-inducible protein A [Elusimicrobiota bacterium]|jgi:nicotinamide-nucleotide amidase|nr:competence/damage-inducible protein A [Elusimicrobiota bacterium]